ncbi:DnaD domain protein [Priestia filamentosa]|uniref:DnaD domain protein n=1 Tax=Priestia filamentosa TaxID=1402861 RepID=UPI00397D9C70
MKNEGQTKQENTRQEQELIQLLEQVEVKELIEGIYQNEVPKEFLEQWVKLFGDIKDRFKLPNGVVNVLFYYVFIKTDGEFKGDYVAKIAAHWARKRIRTVKDAMYLAKQEHKEYQRWVNNHDHNDENDPISMKAMAIANAQANKRIDKLEAEIGNLKRELEEMKKLLAKQG